MRRVERQQLTFRQAEGLEPLPAPLALGQLSEQFRALAWFAAFQSMHARQDEETDWTKWADNDWHTIMRDWHIRVMHQPVDEFSPLLARVTIDIKMKVLNWDYDHLFGFLTFVLRHPRCPAVFTTLLESAFRDSRIAYRIIDKTIFPNVSPEEGQALSSAYFDLGKTEFNGAKAHLRAAADLISKGDNAGSIRESIHSVEAVSRLISPGSNTLDPALKALAGKGHVHPALQAGFGKLYGYVNDEEGIRHPLLERGTAAVDQTDAVYMIGACAAFISYLLKRREG